MNRIERRRLEAACPQDVLLFSSLRVRREGEGTPAPFVPFSFMRLALKRCKDNAALRRSRAATRPCERSRGAQFRDNAAVTDGHGSLPSLSMSSRAEASSYEGKTLPPARKLFSCSKSLSLPSTCNSSRNEFRAPAVTVFAQRNSNKRSAVESDRARSVVKRFCCFGIE